jgi:hypothetical protein
MPPFSERYSDLLGDGTDPALIRLIEDLDRACAPGPLPARHDSAVAHTIEKNIPMQPSITRVPVRLPAAYAPHTPRTTRGKAWLTMGWAALLPTVLLMSLVVVLHYRQPSTVPHMGTAPNVSHVAADTPFSATVKPGTWTITGSQRQPGSFQAATLLADGQVLVAGGCRDACQIAKNPGDAELTNSNRTSAELYDPRTGKWTMTGSMHDGRTEFTMTLLPNGQVLVAGGCLNADCSTILAGAELYNPQTGKWTVTGPMHDVRAFHTATLLGNGQVLVAGGASGAGMTADAELYNPRTGKWTMTGSMHTDRVRHTATLLTNGEVLVAGGTTDNGTVGQTAGAELYSPRTGTWILTDSMHQARALFTAVSLLSGEVLVAGGVDIHDTNARLTSAELYNPSTGKWTITGSLHHPRDYETAEAAVLLPAGQVLVAGDGNPDSPLADAELYNPRTGKWVLTGSLHQARSFQTTTLLANGEVLVAGGSLNYSGSHSLAGAEIYHP